MNNNHYPVGVVFGLSDKKLLMLGDKE